MLYIKSNWQKCEQNGNLLPSIGNVKCYNYFGKQYGIASGVNITLPYNSAVQLIGINIIKKNENTCPTQT